jgi:hypothetical protein
MTPHSSQIAQRIAGRAPMRNRRLSDDGGRAASLLPSHIGGGSGVAPAQDRSRNRPIAKALSDPSGGALPRICRQPPGEDLDARDPAVRGAGQGGEEPPPPQFQVDVLARSLQPFDFYLSAGVSGRVSGHRGDPATDSTITTEAQMTAFVTASSISRSCSSTRSITTSRRTSWGVRSPARTLRGDTPQGRGRGPQRVLRSRRNPGGA